MDLNAKFPKLLIALPLLLATGLPGAQPDDGYRRLPGLGPVIAQQGNLALEQIQAEAARLPLPELPPLAAVEAR